MKLWLSSVYALFLRYKTVFCEVWKIRKQLDTPVREANENEFLPAHLELIETPVSKKTRLIAHLIMFCLFLAILLAVFGKAEIVATATGKLTLSGRSKEIKPIENALVRDIFVKEGDSVEKGQILLKLTALGADADQQKTESLLSEAKLERLRYQFLIIALDSEQSPKIDFKKFADQPISEEAQLRVTRLIEEQYSTWKKQKHQRFLNLKKKEAEKQTVLSRIKKFESVSKTEKERLKDFKVLYEQKAIAKHALLDQENKYIDATNELAVYKSQLVQMENEVLQAQEELELATKVFRNELLEKLRQSDEQIKQLTLELERNKQRQTAAIIRAPVAGTVQQLKTHTIDGVVTTAETLMVIVPEEDTLEVSALIPNKDIGFVEAGQEVVVKLEAFPYTRYGYITGKVKSISLDAIEHPQLGLVFNALIKIDQHVLMSEGKTINLTSGMAVTAEIKTGMRSIISYLLSPLEETVSEGLRER